MKLKYPHLVGGVLLLLGSVMWVGRLSTANLWPDSASFDRPKPVNTEWQASDSSDRLSAGAQKRQARTAAVLPRSDQHVVESRSAAAGALLDVQRLLLATAMTASDDQRLAELQDQLLVLAATDDATRTQLSHWLRSDPGGRLGAFALSVLDQLARPDVLQLGMELAQSPDRASILAGLDILGQQGEGTQQVLDVTEPLLSAYPDDPDVLVAALHTTSTLSTLPPDAVVLNRLLSDYATLSAHQDPAVRSASLFGLTRYARSSNDLRTVIQALDHADPEDRISAAMALEQSADVSASLREAFLTHVANTDEVWEVRRMSADALARFTLNEAAKKVVAQFRIEQELVTNESVEPSTTQGLN